MEGSKNNLTLGQQGIHDNRVQDNEVLLQFLKMKTVGLICIFLNDFIHFAMFHFQSNSMSKTSNIGQLVLPLYVPTESNSARQDGWGQTGWHIICHLIIQESPTFSWSSSCACMSPNLPNSKESAYFGWFQTIFQGRILEYLMHFCC